MWEQIGILILIGLVSLVDWAMKRSRAQRAKQKQRTSESVSENPYVAKQRPSSQESAPARQGEDAKDMRRFLEALGLPVDQTLPTSTRPQTPTPQPKPRTYTHPVRAERRSAPPLPSPAVVANPSHQRSPQRPSQEQARIASQFEHATAKTTKDVSGSAAMRHSFQGRTALRQAIVAREVLGPPLALRGEGMGWEW